MRELSLFFNFKPLSLNQAFKTLRNGRRCKSKAYKDYETLLKWHLKTNSFSLIKFSETFDPEIHEIYLDMIIYLTDFSTKKGAISKTAGDLMNMEKVTTDIIFKELELDDSFITSANLSKNFGTKNCFVYMLNIKERARMDTRVSFLE